MSEGSPLRLRARGLSKKYGAVQALCDVDFELRAGEVVALLGENGAGKSTLVKVLSGLLQPDSGTIEMDGVEVDLSTSAKSQAAGIAVVQQEYSLVPSLTIAENLLLGRQSSGAIWRRGRIAAEAKPILEQVGLGELDPLTRVEKLSVAEKQLVEIARILARDAKIVIFDEPTAALSDAEIERVLSVVRRLAHEGRSIIYVTHRLPEVFKISDRVTVFREGRNLQSIPTTQLDVDAVISLMLGRELTSMYPTRPDAFGDVALTVKGLRTSSLRCSIDLDVRAGEIVGLTGQLGSGAESFVLGLAGMVHRVVKQVSLDGKAVDTSSRARGLHNGIALCSADRKNDGIFAGLSILQNLSSPWLSRVSTLGVLSFSSERAVSTEISRTFAIDARRLKDPVGTLSGGNQQKVALGKWLGSEPRVLLVIEPTRGVDVGARADIYQKLRDLCAAGMAVIVASSDTAEIYGLSDTIATFTRGRMTAIRPQAEWTEITLTREIMHSGEAA